MSLEEMRLMFDGDEEPKLDDPQKFKIKLGIGDETYKYLTSYRSLQEFLAVSSVGVASSAIAGASWYSSLGLLSKVGLSMGLVSMPLGWFALVGVGGATCAYTTKKIYNKIYDASVYKVAKHVSTPIDLLAEGVLYLLLPPMIRVASSDSKFSFEEEVYIKEEFHQEWGYNINYISEKINKYKIDINKDDMLIYKKRLQKACKDKDKQKDMNYEKVKSLIIHYCNEIISADNVRHPSQVETYNELEKIFTSKNSVKNETFKRLNAISSATNSFKKVTYKKIKTTFTSFRRPHKTSELQNRDQKSI